MRIESILFTEMPVISSEFATNATVSPETAAPWSRFRESSSTSRPVSLNTASVSILAPMGIVTSSFGAGIPAPILLFLRDNPSSYPPNTNRPKTATLIRRIPTWKTAFRPVLCLVAKNNRKAASYPLSSTPIAQGVSTCADSRKSIGMCQTQVIICKMDGGGGDWDFLPVLC